MAGADHVGVGAVRDQEGRLGLCCTKGQTNVDLVGCVDEMKCSMDRGCESF